MGKRVAIAEQMLEIETAINVLLGEASLLAVFGPFGYDVAALTAAKALYEQVEELRLVQAVKYGDQRAATTAVAATWAAAHGAYARSLRLARVAFRGDVKGELALGLNGRRKQSLAGWLEQAETFYQGLLGDGELLAGMAQFSYDQARVEGELALVAAVKAANVVQERAKGEARAATRARDAKLAELERWFADFKAVAQVALADTPTKLVMLGF